MYMLFQYPHRHAYTQSVSVSVRVCCTMSMSMSVSAYICFNIYSYRHTVYDTHTVATNVKVQ